MFFHYSVMISVEKSCMSKKCINSTVDKITRDSSLKLDVHQVSIFYPLVTILCTLEERPDIFVSLFRFYFHLLLCLREHAFSFFTGVLPFF